ncbi:MAG: hypothetical protein HY701_11630 [Gemmatimonadetes bacterium]|nr:hypothetical protein [Gemmatimonadota bacterium]
MIPCAALLWIVWLAGTLPCAAGAGSVEGRVTAVNARVAGSVVFLVPENAGPYPPSAPALIDQVNLRFVPRVVVVTPGSTVQFRNSDPILHNVFSPRGPGEGFDLGTYPRGERRARTFTDPGFHVILCHVHPEMAAFVAVVPSPYHAVVDEAGRFRIETVPAGRYTLHVWSRRREPDGLPVVVREGDVLRVEVDLGRGDQDDDSGLQGGET